jgi:hypothetical protein
VGLAAEVARNWIEGDTAGKILSAIIAENEARRAMALEIFKERDDPLQTRRALSLAQIARALATGRLRPRRPRIAACG